MRVANATSEAGSRDRTVHALKKQFFDNQGELREIKLGKYERVIVYHDEEIKQKSS